MTHTPGPWRYEFGEDAGYDSMSSAFVIRSENQAYRAIATLDIADYVRRGDSTTYEQEHVRDQLAEANARLIAAAPDLYEIVKGLCRSQPGEYLDIGAARAVIAKIEATP